MYNPLMKPTFLILATLSLLSCSSPRTVSFPTSDGGIVYADLYGTGNKALILAHGGRFTKESWADQAPLFADAGFQVVAIDFRGRGKSVGGPEDQRGNNAYLDVVAAVEYMQQAGATSVSVVGASFGGWASAQANVAIPDQIDRLVLLAAPAPEPEKLTGRKLFILARDDSRGEGTLRLPGIQAQFDRAPEPKELVLLEGSAHAQFLFDTDQGERLMHEILRFLTEP
jgi:pimeloyl-ACP methyl ester carboxylesterase